MRTDGASWLPSSGRADARDDADEHPSAVAPSGAAPVGRRRARELVERVGLLGERMAALRAAQLRAVADLVSELEGLPGLVVDEGAGERVPTRGGPPGGGGPPGDAQDAAAAEVAVRLRLSGLAAQRLVDEAVALCTRLPRTLAALEAGAIDDARARVVSEQTAVLDDERAGQVEAVLAPEMGSLTAGELRVRVRHAVAVVDAAAVRVRARRAVADREVRLVPLEDGVAQLSAVGPALDLAVVFDRLTGLARDRSRWGGRTDPHAAFVHAVDPEPGGGGLPDRRGVAARRFDALVELAGGGAPGSVVGAGGPDDRSAAPADGSAAPRWSRAGGPQVLVALTSVLGLDAEPAQVAGMGPIPVEVVRQVIVDHPFRRVLTDRVTGQLLGVDGHLVPAGPLPPTAGTPPPGGEEGGGDGAGEGDGDDGGGDPPGGGGGDRPGGAAGARRRPSGGAAPGGAARSTGPDVHVLPAARSAAAPDAARRESWGSCPVAAAGGGSYAPGAALARLVRARTPRCSAPGCRVPATRCDLDHRTPWPEGPTCACNLAPLCRRHHLAKHRFGWSVETAGAGVHDTTARWTSPTGQVVVVPAQPFLPAPVRAAGGGPGTRDRGTPAAPVAYAPVDAASGDARRVRALAAVAPGRRVAGGAGWTRSRERVGADDPPPF